VKNSMGCKLMLLEAVEKFPTVSEECQINDWKAFQR
jgi:hypothetical protein